jgi:hypothetical protein
MEFQESAIGLLSRMESPESAGAGAYGGPVYCPSAEVMALREAHARRRLDVGDDHDGAAEAAEGGPNPRPVEGGPSAARSGAIRLLQSQLHHAEAELSAKDLAGAGRGARVAFRSRVAAGAGARASGAGAVGVAGAAAAASAAARAAARGRGQGQGQGFGTAGAGAGCPGCRALALAERRRGGGPPLRLELQASGLPALEARARGLGVTATVLEKLMLKSNPKRLLVEMLVNREAKRAAEAG